MTIVRPDITEILFMIVTPVSDIPQSVAKGLREARRLFAIQPWTDPEAR